MLNFFFIPFQYLQNLLFFLFPGLFHVKMFLVYEDQHEYDRSLQAWYSFGFVYIRRLVAALVDDHCRCQP